MAYDPKETRDTRGRWSSGGGRSKFPSNNKVTKVSEPNAPVSSGKRWGRMNSGEKAKLTASARFKGTSQSAGAFRGTAGDKGGKTKPAMIATPFQPSEPDSHAVLIQTSKALERDFHREREKADQASMHAALAKSKVPIVKYPSTKPKR